MAKEKAEYEVSIEADGFTIARKGTVKQCKRQYREWKRKYGDRARVSIQGQVIGARTAMATPYGLTELIATVRAVD